MLLPQKLVLPILQVVM